ncbi:Na+/H+ antiporter subunit E [Papillibacter cinnamivorans]|uniref:Multisubunit sodium/proton antiporter, MrpE subunit n=1 Tax=Papillibacter cinnamivorans DSM 12816 TaxID=1122930 RepID=A0A1W2C5B1_9FIRM|nr:Na+/H+ antiporter subunit E [Papillibacter cinnamivorans]SMC80204.1 multisubunit sodium/proton antiporter, MrpE subunit [Papillibacter cinnamivorans DSM 12816]
MDRQEHQKVPRKKLSLRHFLIIFFVLLGLWFLLSGHFEANLVIYGVAACAVSAWLGAGMLATPLRGDGRSVSFGKITGLPKLIAYCVWLLIEIVKANIQVAMVVLNPKLPIDPCLVRFRMDFQNPLADFVLANSITLTPGTVTIDVRDGEYYIHCLTAAAADGVRLQENGKPCDMACRVAKLFGEEILPPCAAGEVSP